MIIQTPKGQGYFPCHASKQSISIVTCTHVKLPRTLCSTCRLRPPSPDGQFSKCSDIYDTSTSECHADLQTYIDNNECDFERRRALSVFLSPGTGNADREKARSVLDYFLYSLCENCCDCIPMGRKIEDYDRLSEVHDDIESPLLWDEERGNCQAHAVHDVCKAFPKITYFSQIGQRDSFKRLEDGEGACVGLRKWLRSKESKGWQENPKTIVTDNVRLFLRSLLHSSKCSNKGTWQRCFDLENKQDHLQLPSDSIPLTPVPSATSSTTPTIQPSSSSTTNTDVPSITNTAVPSATTPTAQPSSSISNSPTIQHSSTTTNIATPTVTPSISISPTPSLSLGVTPSTTLTTVPIPTSSSSPSFSSENISQTLQRACFPSSSTVQTSTGSKIQISAVRMNDKLLSCHNKTSQVYLFTHRDLHTTIHTYMTISTKSNNTLTIHPHHLIPTKYHGVIPARKLNRSHYLQLASGEWSSINEIKRNVEGKGLVNIHTFDGSLVVDGIVTSCFTEYISPGMAHGLLIPFRAMYQIGISFNSLFNYGIM